MLGDENGASSSTTTRVSMISPEIDARSSKATSQLAVDPRRIGTFTKVGANAKNDKTNQDRGLVCCPFCDASDALLAIFDGHGKLSEKIAAWAVEQLPVLLEARKDELTSGDKSASQVLFQTIVRMDKALLAHEDRALRKAADSAGTTATIVYLHDGKLHVACAGDSRAVLGSDVPGAPATSNRRGGSQPVVALELTTDHKPDEPKERTRIEQAGGSITAASKRQGAARVWAEGCGGMAVSRSLGDGRHKETAGVISDPEIHSVELDVSDRFVIVASDGLWEYVTSQEACDVVAKHLKHAREASAALVKLAEKRWNARAAEKRAGDTRDDITVTVALLPLQAGPTVSA